MAYWSFTWNNITQRKLRSWLTILGIVIGIGAIIALISLSQGMENALEEQFSRLGSDIIQIVPAQLRGPPTGEYGLDERIVDRVSSLKEVEYANPLVLNFGSVEYNKQREFIFVNGYDTDLSGKGFIDADIKIEEGRLFAPGERNVAVIGNDIGHETFDKDIRVKNTITLEDKKLRVIGIFESTGTPLDDRVYIPLEDARAVFGRKDIVNAVAVKLKPNVGVETGKRQIEKEVKKVIDDEEFELFTPDQILGQFSTILGVLQAVLVGIACISLLVGAIGIMNSMFTSVLERTREIGVMKAIGAQNKDILTIFLLEAGIIGTIGGVLGTVGGAVLAKSIEFIIHQNGFPLLQVRIDPFLIGGGLAFAFIVGVVSGIVPAYRASRLQPVDALRYE